MSKNGNPYLSAFQVKLKVFNGPLDLLWALIAGSKLDITEVPIAQITKEFLQYIACMEILEFELTSDFLWMASMLVHYKSCALLPSAEPEAEDLSAPLPPELVRQLLEYKKYQLAAKNFESMSESREKIFFAGPKEFIFTVKPTSEKEPVSIVELVHCFENIKKRGGRAHIRLIRIHEPTMDRYIKILREKLRFRNSVMFNELFDADDDKVAIVTGFLAILEMARKTEVIISQYGLFGKIRIYRSSET